MPTFSSLPGFRVLPLEVREQIDRSAHLIAVHRGQVLFDEGADAEALWAVDSGKVHIVKAGPDGREIVLEVMAPGDLFGAVAAIENRRYPASAVAAGAGGVWCLAASTTREICLRYPTLRNAIMGEIASRLRNAHDRLRSVALEKVEQRLARALLALAHKIGIDDQGRKVTSVTRQELADMTGTTVESAIRVTSRWQSRGWISTARNQIWIDDREHLEAIARGDDR